MIAKDSFESYHNLLKRTGNCTGSIVIDMEKKEKQNENHDSPKAHSKINHFRLGREVKYYGIQTYSDNNGFTQSERN